MRLTKHEMVICPFVKKEVIRLDGRFFRVNKKDRRLEYCVLGNERKRVMDEVSRTIIKQINKQGNTYFNEGDFVEIFGDWFKRLCNKRIASNSTARAEIEMSFMQEGKELAERLVAAKNKIAIIEEQKASDVVESQKQDENLIVNFKLKTGNVKIEFENKPNEKDLEMLNQYLNYHFGE